MNREDYTQHISQQFNAELEEVRTHFLAMGGLVEKQVTDAITALLDADSMLAQTVQDNDRRINQMESTIDEEIVRILARRQPAASDLRMVMSISKSLTDLERMGDEAAKIARAALSLCEEGESPRGYIECRHIGNRVRQMIHDTLDAFAHFDVEQGLAVMQADTDVDLEYRTASLALITYMMEDPRAITRVLSVMGVLRSLERVGDHARNIAEQLIFLVKGDDVRHSTTEQIKQRLQQTGKA